MYFTYSYRVCMTDGTINQYVCLLKYEIKFAIEAYIMSCGRYQSIKELKNHKPYACSLGIYLYI